MTSADQLFAFDRNGYAVAYRGYDSVSWIDSCVKRYREMISAIGNPKPCRSHFERFATDRFVLTVLIRKRLNPQCCHPYFRRYLFHSSSLWISALARIRVVVKFQRKSS